MRGQVKGLLWAGLLGVVAAACGGGSGPDGDPDPDPIQGTPAGDPVTVTLGPQGGSLATTDGGFVLTVPAGALNEPTSITVQPVISTVPHGYGLAYRIEPGSLALSVPAEVTLSIDEAAIPGVHPSTIGIAYRDANGDWLGLPGTAKEPEPVATSQLRMARIGRVVRTRVGFDGFEYALMAFWRITPQAPIVLDPGASVQLRVEACLEEVEQTNARRSRHTLSGRTGAAASFMDDDELPDLPPRQTCAPSIREATWYVQGLNGGNASLGFVAAGTPSTTAEFLAPNRAPTPNPVTVSVSLYWRSQGVTASGLPQLKVPIAIRSGNLRGTASGTLGSAIATVGALVTFSANVTWELDRAQSIPTLGIEVFTPRGTAVVASANRCISRIRPDTVVITPDMGRLTIQRLDSLWTGEGNALPPGLFQYYDTCASMDSYLDVYLVPFLMDDGPQNLPVQGVLRLPANSGTTLSGSFSYEPE